MTEKQASAWVEENCRFAMIEEARSIVRTAASKAGLNLTDGECSFYAVKAIVCASLKVAEIDTEQMLKGFGIDLNSLIERALSQCNAEEALTKAPMLVFDMLKQQEKALRTSGKPVPTIGFDTQRLLRSKVQEISAGDPAKFYNLLRKDPVGPHSQQERARGYMPVGTQQTQAPRTVPNPESQPIPRKPFSPALPKMNRPIPA